MKEVNIIGVLAWSLFEALIFASLVDQSREPAAMDGERWCPLYVEESLCRLDPGCRWVDFYCAGVKEWTGDVSAMLWLRGWSNL